MRTPRHNYTVLQRGLTASTSSVQSKNFELLHRHQDWRHSWTHIVSGRFSSSPYSSLLFYERSKGYAEFYQTDGHGGISLLRQHTDWRDSWTRIIPGIFGNSGFSGLLLYDRKAGVGAFYDTDGAGNLILLGEDDSWRKSWTHIVAGAFTESPYSGLLFYDQAAGFGAIYTTDGSGRLKLLREYSDWRTSWTQIVTGEFYHNGYPPVPTIADLFFYEGATGYGETYSSCTELQGEEPLYGQISFLGSQQGLPKKALILPGNFGGGVVGWTNLLFYEKRAGKGTVYCQDDSSMGNWSPKEVNKEWRRSWDIIVPGNFWMANEEDSNFWMGYEEHQNWPEGGFTDLLFYNRNKGIGEFYLHEPLNPTVVEPLAGYVSAGSVISGETITFHISSQLGSVRPFKIKIYRQDFQEMPMADVPVTGPIMPYYISRTAYQDGAGWPEVGRLTIPDDWPSGLYLARVYIPPIVKVGDHKKLGNSHLPLTDVPPLDIPFVVRSSQPGKSTSILLVIPDTTYEAYNSWGGRSLYGYGHNGEHTWAFPQTALRLPYAFKVSFQRPHTGQGDHGKRWQVQEVPFIRWLALQEIGVELCTASDLHKNNSPQFLQHYRLVVNVGHSEYWSKEMRDHLERFVRAGGNAAFFGANNCWWQVRFDNEGRMVCYKQAKFDPNNVSNDSQQQATVTVNWHAQPVNRPETSLTGVSYFGTPFSFPLPPKPGRQVAEFEVQEPDHWVFAKTGLKKNQMFGQYACTNTIMGPELDKRQDNDLLRSPTSFKTLAIVYILDQGVEIEVGTMGIFQKGKGFVFTASTIDWAKGLSLDSKNSNFMDTITRNVLTELI